MKPSTRHRINLGSVPGEQVKHIEKSKTTELHNKKSKYLKIITTILLVWCTRIMRLNNPPRNLAGLVVRKF
jgi:hypothetical protein